MAAILFFLVFGLVNSASVVRQNDEKSMYFVSSNADMTECELCGTILEVIQNMIQQGQGEEEIFQFIRRACIVLQVPMPHVCNHIIETFGDELIFVMNHTQYAPLDICDTFISGCAVNGSKENSLWNFDVPCCKPPIKNWPIVPQGKPTLRVLHLSDIHIDSNYTKGSEADCQYEWFSLCCRTDLGRTNMTRNSIKLPSGDWGMPNHCDIPQKTFEHAIKHIAATEKNLDYIIVTGDLEAHNMWEYSREDTATRVNYVNSFLRQHFGNVPVFNSIGNHEGVPGDAMASHNMVEYDSRGPSWLYEVLNQAWQTWLPANTSVDVKYRASYAVRPYSGLKLISINTIYCSHFNFYVYTNLSDPDDTLKWLTNHLLESEKLGEKVHLISHIPTGSSYCLRGWAHNFYNIVNRFENTIAAQFYGHTHQDHFQVYFENADPKARPSHINFIAPSLTTYAYNNPAYRIYTIDGNYKNSTFTVIDYETHFANLTKANSEGEPTWEHSYNMKAAYNLTDLSPQSLAQLTDALVINETLFRQYFIFYHRNDAYKMSCINELNCRKAYACACKSARSYDEDNFCPK